MKFTSSQLNIAFRNAGYEADTPQAIQRSNLIAARQKQNEQTLLANTQVCSIPVIEDINNKLSDLDPTNLQKFISSQFYNQNVMNAMMCTVNSVAYASPYDTGSYPMNEKIRKYFRNLQQIGSDSVEGYALLSDFDDMKDSLIIKVSRDPGHDELLHELIVGIFGTNQIRSRIPNYAYLYGGWKCSPPAIDPNTKEVTAWCLNNNNSVNYIAYEAITPSVSARQYFKTIGDDPMGFLNVYLQVLNALQIGLETCDFTHNDLHDENVLIRQIPKTQGSKKFDYQNNNKFQIFYKDSEYFTTDVFPVIIDFGISHIFVPERRGTNGVIIPGAHYGPTNREWHLAYPNQSNIMGDAYKFFMYCVFNIRTQGYVNTLNLMRKIFTYWNDTEDLEFALLNNSDTRYVLPLNDVTRSMSIPMLIDHIRGVAELPFIGKRDRSLRVLDCENLCLTENEVLNEIGLNKRLAAPDDAVEMWSLVHRLNKERLYTERDLLLQQFAGKYHIAMGELLKDIVGLNNEIMGPVPVVSSRNFETKRVLKEIQGLYYGVADKMEAAYDIVQLLKVAGDLSSWYRDEKTIEKVQTMTGIYNTEAHPQLIRYLDELRVIGKELDNAGIRPVLGLGRRSPYEWYLTGRKVVESAIGV